MFTIQPTEKLLGFSEDDLEVRNGTQSENQLGVIVPTVCNLAPSQIPEVKSHGIPSASPFGSGSWNSLSCPVECSCLGIKGKKALLSPVWKAAA